MNRLAFRYFACLFLAAYFSLGNLLAQNEAESASDAIVQSNTNGRTKNISKGESIKYRLVGEKKYNKRAVFNGILGETLIIGNDTVPISQLQTIATRNEKQQRTGKHFLIFHFVGRAAVYLSIIALTAVGVSSNLAFLIILGILAAIIAIVTVPFFYIGLILLIVANRTFDVHRLWKLKAKPKQNPAPLEPEK